MGVSFAALAQSWRAAETGDYSAASLTRLDIQLDSYLLPRFGDMPAAEVTEEVLGAWTREMVERGLSFSTVNSLLSVVKSILDSGGFGVKMPLVRGEEKPLRVLTPAEQRALVFFLLADLTPAHLGMLLSLYLGLRHGEVCALRWDDVDFDARLLRVSRTMHRVKADYRGDMGLEGKYRTEGKTALVMQPLGSDCLVRDIPLAENLLSLLRDHAPARPEGIFVLTGTDVCLDPRSLDNRFRRAAAFCGIQNVSFQALRDTFAVRCVENGVGALALTDILGSAAVGLTVSRYGIKTSLPKKRKEIEKISALL